jgi:hypothetical protein
MANTTAFGGQTSVTRPANTTPAYDANDVVGATAAVWKFNSMGPAGGKIVVTSVSLRINTTAVPAGMTSFRLYLYRATPPSALADKAAWTLHADDLSVYAGYIDLGSPALPAASSAAIIVQSDQINKQFYLAPGCSDLWGYLVTAGTYTPASATVHVIEMHSLAG